jgi:hypothetical protein
MCEVPSSSCRCVPVSMPPTEAAETVLALIAIGAVATVAGAVFEHVWILAITTLALGWLLWWKPTRMLLRLTARGAIALTLWWLDRRRARRVAAAPAPLTPPLVVFVEGRPPVALDSAGAAYEVPGRAQPARYELERAPAHGRAGEAR